jgi:hypothetical protein
LITQGGTVIQQIAFTITSAYIDLLTAGIASEAGKVKFLEENFKIPTRFISTTNEPGVANKSKNINLTASANLPKTINDQINNQEPDAEFIVKHELNGNSLDVPIIEENGNRNLFYMKQHACSTLPRSTQIYTETCGGTSLGRSPTPTPDGTPRNVSNQGYIIDLKNTSCRVENPTALLDQKTNGEESLRSFILRYYTRWGPFGVVNFERFANTIQDLAVARGYNPAFLLSMWLEETAASGVDNQQSWAFGCRGDLRNDNRYGSEITLQIGETRNQTAVSAHINEQFECIANTLDAAYRANPGLTARETYSRFMKAWSSGSYTGLFPTGPNGVISLWYNELAGQCGVVETVN